MSEWKAHVAWDLVPTMDARRVLVYRPLAADRVEVVTGFEADGRPVTEQLDPAVVHDFRGLLLPAEAIQALAEAVKPGPSQGEVARLEEALAVERRRVDDTLAAGRVAP